MIGKFRNRYIDLTIYKAYAELKTEVSRYTIGIIWWILDPILYMAVFYVVFSVLPIRGRPDGFVAFLLAGLVAFRWFQKSITGASESMIKSRSLMQSVYLPKWIFPASSLLADLLRFFIILLLLLVFLWSSGHSPNDHYWALPLIFVVQFFLILAPALFLASLLPLLPDVKFLVTHGLHMLFLVSGIFFSGEQIPAEYRDYFYMNPMANMLEAWRDVLIYDRPPDFDALILIGTISILLCLPGIYLLNRMDRRYPKMVADK